MYLPSFTTYRSVSNVEFDESVEDQADDPVDDNDDEFLQPSNEPGPSQPSQTPPVSGKTSSSQHATFNLPEQTTSKKRARRNDPIDEDLMLALNSAQKTQTVLLNEIKKCDDEDSLFAQSIASSLKRLTPYKKALAKSKIQQVLLD